MQKSKITKRALLSSVVALVLCISMLVGTTFAWFTDSVSSGVNSIHAGNLDIEVQYSTNGTTWNDLNGTGTLFSGNLWEPGHTEVVYLRVKNAGTLALNYKVLVTPVSESGGINVAGNPFKLSDYLVFGTTNPVQAGDFGVFANREAARNAVGDTTGLADANSLTKTGTMVGKDASGYEDQYMALVVYMPESVGNEANYKTGTTPPTIELGIKVVATQLAEESDSFGNNYDEGAVNTPFYTVGAYYDYFEAVNVTANADENGNFTVTKTDGNSGIIASASGTANAGAEVNLIVTKSSEAEKNFTITVEDGHELNGYDIKVTGQANGSLVQGKLYVGTGLENFKFYHNNSLMTVGTKGSLTNGQYCYDPTEGYVYFATSTFSPFQATYKAPVAAIGTAVYGTLADAFAAVQSGETITLLKNSAGNGIVVPSGSNFTVDFRGFTYDIDGSTVGSAGTETNGFQLLKDSSIIFKDGSLTSSRALLLIQNYANLTLDNMNLSASAPCEYVLSNNNGDVIIKDTTITAPEGQVAFDICSFGNYRGPEVTVKGNSVINGKVEISEYNGSHDMLKLNVTGGTFNGEIYKANEAADFVGNITGGRYSIKPSSEYLAIGYKAAPEGEYYVVSLCTDHVYEGGVCKECGKVQETWLAIENAMTEAPEGYSVDGTNVTISTNYGFAWFAKQVNAGNNFANYTVKLTDDIDLLDYPWTPINGFTGTFDGGEHTISNLYFHSTATSGQGFGLFGQSNGQVKNLTIHNAHVMGNAACGAFVGQGNGLLENLHLTGRITIGTTTDQGHLANFNSSYIGGIRGNSFRGKIKNCTVIGDENSVICGGRQVGGIIGFDSYGFTDSVVGCTVKDIHILGGKSVGGIVGWANSTGIQNCGIENVCVELVDAAEPETIGLISGTSRCLINDSETTVYANNTVDAASRLIVNGETPSFDSHPVLRLYSPYSSETYVTLAEGKYMFTCYGITKAMTKGDHITLLNSISEQVTISENRTITIDLNGYTLLGEFGTPVITNNGTLIIKNGTIAGELSGENITTENVTVTEPVCVATIGETKYRTLAKAIEMANNGDVIQLQQDIVETVEVCEGQILTIDLNGYKITGVDNYTLDIYGELTLLDTNGGGEVVGTSFTVYNNSTGILNVNGGATIRSTSGDVGYYGLAVYNEGTVNVSGGSILCVCDDNTHWYHAPVYNDGGTVSITGGTFTKQPGGVADGYQAIENADGTWTVVAEN